MELSVDMRPGRSAGGVSGSGASSINPGSTSKILGKEVTTKVRWSMEETGK
jgi:hypothetical protein